MSNLSKGVSMHWPKETSTRRPQQNHVSLGDNPAKVAAQFARHDAILASEAVLVKLTQAESCNSDHRRHVESGQLNPQKTRNGGLDALPVGANSSVTDPSTRSTRAKRHAEVH